jgi:SagB-type dehydrogenase family enzyme
MIECIQTAFAQEESMPEARPLPPPRHDGPLSFEKALMQRRSTRTFQVTPLTPEQISQLLWAAQGQIGDHRTAPSAGALYPIELYTVESDGVYHYQPAEHNLVTHSSEDCRSGLYTAALEQDSIRKAPFIIVISGVYRRIEVKYGVSRGPRYVQMEAGHVAQNILLQAVALGLGAVAVGAFHDAKVHKLLQLPPDYKPLYLVPVGHPA